MGSYRPYHPYRLWLPNGWFDWSVFHLGDGDGEETLVVQVPPHRCLNTTVRLVSFSLCLLKRLLMRGVDALTFGSFSL